LPGRPCRGPCPPQRLFGQHHAIGVELHGAVAGRQLLEPVQFRLRRRQAAVERGRGVRHDPLVEQAALGQEIITPLPGGLEPAAGGFQADLGRAIERPGRAGGDALAHQADGNERIGERRRDLRLEEQPREKHAETGDEQAAQAEEPGHRNQLLGEAGSHLAFEAGDRALDLGKLVPRLQSLPQRRHALACLLDRLGEREPAERRPRRLHHAADLIVAATGLGHCPLRGTDLAGGTGQITCPGAERTERMCKAFGQQHLG